MGLKVISEFVIHLGKPQDPVTYVVLNVIVLDPVRIPGILLVTLDRKVHVLVIFQVGNSRIPGHVIQVGHDPFGTLCWTLIGFLIEIGYLGIEGQFIAKVGHGPQVQVVSCQICIRENGSCLRIGVRQPTVHFLRSEIEGHGIHDIMPGLEEILHIVGLGTVGPGFVPFSKVELVRTVHAGSPGTSCAGHVLIPGGWYVTVGSPSVFVLKIGK